MSTVHDVEPGFDPRIADWLEADPHHAPTRVLETALAAAPSIPQRRASRMPRRFPVMQRFVIIGAVVGAVLVAALGTSLLAGRPPTIVPSNVLPSEPAVTLAPTPSPFANGLPAGRLLLEHLGNAIDGSEFAGPGAGPSARRFYVVDAHDVSPTSAREFLPGQPVSGKTAADVSSDGRKVVFQSFTEDARLYEANLDGTGFHELEVECAASCALLYPDYDPTATKVVYTHVEGGRSWLEILDLATGVIAPLEHTEGPASDRVPEQPAWSPDGTTIAFTRLQWDGSPAVVGTIHYDGVPTGGTLELVDVASGAVTALPIPVDLRPGDVAWAPDSRSLLFSDAPGSTTGSDGNVQARGSIRRISRDGSGLEVLRGWASPEYLPDASRILYQDNLLFSMLPDGTDPRKISGMDVTTDASGYVYVAHWIPAS